ncbi:hypothetical protein IW147_003597 [Coemansia sp. RSA 720]|nr:hypothetical protein IW147_003597 [Coemansia sp. RSA 720]
MDEEPYIVQTLVQTLVLDESPRVKSVEWPKPRRQSLSQRLGFQAAERMQEDNDAASQASEGADSVDRSASPALRSRAIRIECVELCGTDVYVGTSHGHIVHYTVNVPELTSNAEPERVYVQSVDLKLGKRVEQLIALPMLNRLIVLCGSTLVFYTLSDLRLAGNSAPTIKGVSCVACDERVNRTVCSGTLVCVARMREISVYFVGADVRLEQQVMIEYSVASLCMYGNYVCLADTQTYKVLDLARIRAAGLEQGQLELLPTQQPRRDESGRVVRPPRPRTLVVGPNEFMFLTASGDDTTLGVIVTARGEALRGTLQFPAYPVSIVYDEPHAIAVFATGRIDVYDTRAEPRVVQSVVGDVPDLMRVRKACVCAGGWVSTRVGRREAIDASELRMFEPRRLHEAVSGRDCAVWTEAVDEEVEWRRELVDEGEPPVWPGPDRQNGLDRQAGRGLSRWTDANIVVLGSDSLHILAPQPQLIHIDALLHQQHIKEAVAAVDAALTGTTLSMQSDEAEYCLQMAGMVCLKNMQLDDAQLYFQRGRMDPRALLYLYPSHAEYVGPLLVPFAHIAMAPPLRQLFYEIGSVQSLASPDLQTVDLLEQYLEFCRTQMLNANEPYAPDAVPVIDTVLARVYADNMRHAKFSALVQGPNSVVGDIACAYLESAHKYYDCSLVYMAQGDVRAGLDVWRRMLEGKVSDERFGGMAEYLEYILGDLGDDVGQWLTDEYYWLVRHDVEASRHILACLTDDKVAELDADRVVGDMQAAGAQREFIERLIAANHPRAPHFTTILLTAYVADAAQCTDAESGFQGAQARDLELTFRSYVASAGHSSRARLVEMLGAQRSVFDAPTVLACIEDAGNLGVERAMVLARLGRRDEAVEALVKAGDYAEAEMLLLRPMARESLAKLAKQGASDQATDVAWLLHLVVSVADDDMAARLVSRLLDTYAEHINISTIEELPEHWVLGVVEPFVRHKLGDLAQSERASSLERSVANAHEQNVKMQCAGDLVSHGPVVLGVAQTCGVCRKLLGSSAFVYEPQTKQVKHISCA